MTKNNKFDKKMETLMLKIFEGIDCAKEAEKVYLINAINAPDINKYKSQILTGNEVNETLEYLQYILASKSKYSKRVASLSISILNNNIETLEKEPHNDICKTVIDRNKTLVNHLKHL
jgi:hypothetical protein